MADTKFLIIYDTYCGWCYGASPIFDALVDAGADIEALHRHLFEGPSAFKMSEGKGDMIMQADARISELTGQTFSQAYVDNIVLSDTEVLVSHYTAQAAALVHDQGVAKEFAVRERLELARYVDGVSASDREAVVAALIAEGVSEQDAQRIGTDELAAQAQVTAQLAQKWMSAVGSNGVPTVLRSQGQTVDRVDLSAFYANPASVASLM